MEKELHRFDSLYTWNAAAPVLAAPLNDKRLMRAAFSANVKTNASHPRGRLDGQEEKSWSTTCCA